MIRTAIAASVTLAAVLGASLAFAQSPAAAGEALFGARCNGCHATGAGGAPTRDDLAKKTQAQVIAALTDGPMAPMAGGLSDDDKKAIAAYLVPSAMTAAPAASAAPPSDAAPSEAK